MDADLANLTLRALRRILRITEMGKRQLATATGLTPSQLLVLHEIAARASPTPGAIAQVLQFSQASITAIVDRLVALGLATRQRSEKDKRQFMLAVTQMGLDVLSAAPDALQMQFQDNFAALPRWEQAMMLAAVERLGAMLGAQDMDTAPLLDSAAIDQPRP